MSTKIIKSSQKNVKLDLKLQAKAREKQKRQAFLLKKKNYERFKNYWPRKLYRLRKIKQRLKRRQTQKYFFRTVKKHKRVKYDFRNKYSRKLSIRIRSNNIFCTLVSLKTKKTLLCASAGT